MPPPHLIYRRTFQPIVPPLPTKKSRVNDEHPHPLEEIAVDATHIDIMTETPPSCAIAEDSPDQHVLQSKPTSSTGYDGQSNRLSNSSTRSTDDSSIASTSFESERSTSQMSGLSETSSQHRSLQSTPTRSPRYRGTDAMSTLNSPRSVSKQLSWSPSSESESTDRISESRGTRSETAAFSRTEISETSSCSVSSEFPKLETRSFFKLGRSVGFPTQPNGRSVKFYTQCSVEIFEELSDGGIEHYSLRLRPRYVVDTQPSLNLIFWSVLSFDSFCNF